MHGMTLDLALLSSFTTLKKSYQIHWLKIGNSYGCVTLKYVLNKYILNKKVICAIQKI